MVDYLEEGHTIQGSTINDRTFRSNEGIIDAVDEHLGTRKKAFILNG